MTHWDESKDDVEYPVPQHQWFSDTPTLVTGKRECNKLHDQDKLREALQKQEW